MKTKNLLMLLLLTAVLIGLAYRRARLERRETPFAAGQSVFADMDVNRAARLILSDAGATVTVARRDGRWQVDEKHGYPADFSRLRDLLTGLAGLKIGRPLLLDAGLREELQLTRTGPGDTAAGIHLELRDDSGGRLAALTVGASFHRDHDPGREEFPFQWRGAEGRYVMTDAGKAFLVSETFQGLSARPDDWIDREFVDIPSHKLVAVAVAVPGREDIRLTREGSGEPWRWEDAPDGAKPRASRIGEMTSALGMLAFDAIADPAAPPADLGFTDEETAVIEARLDDGRGFRLTIGGGRETEGRILHPLRIRAEYETPDTTVSEGSAEDAEASLDLAGSVHGHLRETRRINERLAEWTYLCGETSIAKLLIAPEDITEPDTPEPPEDRAEDASS